MSEQINVNAKDEKPLSGMNKEEFLKEEKENAIGMVKMAGFNGGIAQNPYPSPFLSLSDSSIPESSYEIFKWCKYFYTFDPLIAGAINALAAFPVTEVFLEEEKEKGSGKDTEKLKTYERVLYDVVKIHKLLIDIGIDYWLYGNCFIFGEMHVNPNTKQKEWKNVVRLDPSRVIIDYNPATREKVFKWEIPASIISIVKAKKPKDEYEKIPDIMKEAAKKGKVLIINKNNIYHFPRATDSFGDNTAYGTPVIANVLKLLMYRNTLRQAQEAIAKEHIVPMRVYYLSRTEDYNPDDDWNKVAQDFAGELMKATKDPNYKVVSPVPVNLLNVGGQGRALMLTQEIEQIQSEILAGMNVPREFIFGGVSYSGSSISLKILENQFITYRLLLKDFIQNFLVKGMAKERKEWVNESDDDDLLRVKLADLKMQDDVQQKQLIINLNGAGKVSNEFMWQTLGIDSDAMKKAIESEAIESIKANARINKAKIEAEMETLEAQAALQIKQMQMQSTIQSIMPNNAAEVQPDNLTEEGAPNENQSQSEDMQQNVPTEFGEAEKELPPTAQNEEQTEDYSGQNVDGMLSQILSPEEIRFAKQVAKLPEAFRGKILEKIPKDSLSRMKQAIKIIDNATSASQSTDMRPMPEKLPPRRDGLK